jgi:peroxiredoxin
LILLGAGLMVMGVAALLSLPDSESPSQEEGPSAVPQPVSFSAPDLQLVDIDQGSASLSDYRGQVVLVNIWATWCPPCKEEMPTLEAYYRDNKDRGFTIVAIDAGDAESEVARFVDVMDLSFPVWLDPKMAALAAFKYPGLPSSYVIDRSGVVRLAWTGAINRAALDQYVTPIMEE